MLEGAGCQASDDAGTEFSVAAGDPAVKQPAKEFSADAMASGHSEPARFLKLLRAHRRDSCNFCEQTIDIIIAAVP